MGGIRLVPSLFSGLSSVFGRFQNPVLLVLSSKRVGLELGLPNLLLLEPRNVFSPSVFRL